MSESKFRDGKAHIVLYSSQFIQYGYSYKYGKNPVIIKFDNSCGDYFYISYDEKGKEISGYCISDILEDDYKFGLISEAGTEYNGKTVVALRQLYYWAKDLYVNNMSGGLGIDRKYEKSKKEIKKLMKEMKRKKFNV